MYNRVDSARSLLESMSMYQYLTMVPLMSALCPSKISIGFKQPVAVSEGTLSQQLLIIHISEDLMHDRGKDVLI